MGVVLASHQHANWGGAQASQVREEVLTLILTNHKDTGATHPPNISHRRLEIPEPMARSAWHVVSHVRSTDPEQPWPSILTAPYRKLKQKLTPHSQTCCLRAPWHEIPGEDHTFRGASYHREGHLDGTLVQSSVAGTCKAEAGPHLRTSHVCGRRQYGRLCS